MKKYKEIIFFTVTLLAMIFAIQYSLDALYNKRAHQKFARIFKHQIDAEIMVFGSSVAYRHFDPRIISKTTNHTVYNMGWDAMFFVQYDALIKEYLSYEKNCQYLVISCDFENLGKNDLISRPDLFYAYLNNNNVYNALHAIEPTKILLARYLPGYKFTLLGKNIYRTAFIKTADNDTTFGYEPYLDSFQITTKVPFNAKYDDKLYTQFKTRLGEITRKGVKVILVMAPIYKEGYKLILNADFIKNKYKSLENKDIHFMDYTTDTSICNHKEYFRNNSHLEAKGSIVFSYSFSSNLLKIMNTNTY